MCIVRARAQPGVQFACAAAAAACAAAMSEGVLSSKQRPAGPTVTVLPLTPKKILAYVCELQHGVGTGLHVHNVLPPSSKGLLAYVCELQDAVGTGLQRAATQQPGGQLVCASCVLVQQPGVQLACAAAAAACAAAMSEGVLSSKKRPADPTVTALPLSPKKLLAYVCELQHGVGTGTNRCLMMHLLHRLLLKKHPAVCMIPGTKGASTAHYFRTDSSPVRICLAQHKRLVLTINKHEKHDPASWNKQVPHDSSLAPTAA